jgi:hypothetical protein
VSSLSDIGCSACGLDPSDIDDVREYTEHADEEEDVSRAARAVVDPDGPRAAAAAGFAIEEAAAD